MTVDKLNKWCEDCPHAACETCDITWTEIKELKEDIANNYVPKNKIKDLIKEIEEEKFHISWSSADDRDWCIKWLKKLL